MTSFLDPKDGPVIPGLEGQEIVYAKDQPQYLPLRTLRTSNYERDVISRWTLTDEQRQAVAQGADIFLSLRTFGNPLQPILIAVSDSPQPEEFGIRKESVFLEATKEPEQAKATEFKTAHLCGECGHHTKMHPESKCTVPKCACPQFVPSDGEPQTCPRRMQEPGPWEQEEGLDQWVGNHWNPYYHSRWPGEFPKPRTCSFCGSIHPEDAINLLMLGWENEKSTKGYKGYLHPPGFHEQQKAVLTMIQEKRQDFPDPKYPDPLPPAKIYTMHFSSEQLNRLNAAIRWQQVAEQ
jgi:hypothetical protein